jgi:hypothetical protein
VNPNWYVRGKSTSTHESALRLKIVSISVPFNGSTVKEPGKGGPLVDTDTVARASPLFIKVDVRVKTYVARFASEFGLITKFVTKVSSLDPLTVRLRLVEVDATLQQEAEKTVNRRINSSVSKLMTLPSKINGIVIDGPGCRAGNRSLYYTN